MAGGVDDPLCLLPETSTYREERTSSKGKYVLSVVDNFFSSPEDGYRLAQDFSFLDIEDYEKVTELDVHGLDLPPREEGFISPAQALLTRMGAKSQLQAYLVMNFPRDAHTYIEVFGGSFRVLISKGYEDQVEIINDVDTDLVHFYRWVKRYPDELAAAINSIPCHEAVIMGMRDQLGRKVLKGLERAAAYYAGNVTSFNGTGHSYSGNPFFFHFPEVKPSRLRAVAKRLRRVDIRSRSYQSIIATTNKKVPGGGVFYYLDPPYWATAGYSTFAGSSQFGWKEQEELARFCEAIHNQGNRWLQTNSAHPDLFKLYGGLRDANGKPFVRIERRDVKYTVASSQEQRKDTGEYIFSNFDLPFPEVSGKKAQQLSLMGGIRK